MSALDDAVRDYAAQHGFVTGWALVIATSDLETRTTRYTLETAPDQPYHHTAGLIQVGHEVLGGSDEA